MIVIEGRGNATEGLKMRALPQFNGTRVVCVLYIIEPNGTLTVDRSTPATLNVQGTEIIDPISDIHLEGPECNMDMVVKRWWAEGGGRGGRNRRIRGWLHFS